MNKHLVPLALAIFAHGSKGSLRNPLRLKTGPVTFILPSAQDYPAVCGWGKRKIDRYGEMLSMSYYEHEAFRIVEDFKGDHHAFEKACRCDLCGSTQAGCCP